MRSCAAPGCITKQHPGVVFKAFPTHSKIRQIWLTRLKHLGGTRPNSLFLCEVCLFP